MPGDEPYCDPAAPEAATITDYDRRHFYTYARLLDADRAGVDWREAAAFILRLDMTGNERDLERCWRSHLERARWVVEEGVAEIARTTTLAGAR